MVTNEDGSRYLERVNLIDGLIRKEPRNQRAFENEVLQAAIAYRHTVDLGAEIATESNRLKLLNAVDNLIGGPKCRHSNSPTSQI